MKYAILVVVLIIFAAGFSVGRSSAKPKIVYQPKIEYRQDPEAVSKATLESEVADAQKNSYTAGYAEGRKGGLDEGYKSGYVQGTEHGKSLILSEIDLRIQEAERTDQNIPLFRVRRE